MRWHDFEDLLNHKGTKDTKLGKTHDTLLCDLQSDPS